MIIASALYALDKQRWWACTGLAAAVLNPGINLLLIPYFRESTGNGAIGAATSTVITECFLMAVGLCLLRGAVFDRASLSTALRCLAAGGLMVAVVVPARHLFLPVPVAIGAATYGLAAVALGAVSLRDVRRLQAQTLGRMRAAPPAPA